MQNDQKVCYVACFFLRFRVAEESTMNQRPHLQQIADLLGVSKMTVSRALRDGTSVTPELRAKIRETAARLRYRPDSRISRLMSEVRKSRESPYRETLGFIWSHQSARNAKSYFHEGFEAARLRAEQQGCKLDEFHIKDQSLTGRALSRILHSRGIRGALIAPPGDQRSYPHAWLEWKRFCCVLIGRSMANTGLARVQHDHFSGTVLVLRNLRRLHYKRIGLVLAHAMDERSSRLVRSAFLSFHPASQKETEKLIYTSNTFDVKKLTKWIEQKQPGAIITNFEDPFPTLEQIKRICPKNVGLVSLNWSSDQIEVAGILHQRSVIGEEAVDLLMRRLQQNRLGLDAMAPTILVPGSWMDGSSVQLQ
jgi:LacI family transcriptional regulator